MHLFEVIKRPLVTEKSTLLQESGKYIFEVNRKANKQQIKEAVEKAFKVTVISVNIMNMHGEKKRVGRNIVTSSEWKKAIVTLKSGDKIQLFEGL